LGINAGTRDKPAVRDTSDLNQRIIGTWERVSQNVIIEAVDQWRKRLRACKKAKGYRFERLLN